VNQPPLRHHYVSRFYLRYFTDPSKPGYLWVYQKGNSQIWQGTPNGVASKLHYHTIITPTGQLDQETVEQLAQQIEGPAGKVTRKLVQSQLPTAAEKTVYAKFVALTMVRVPTFREPVQQRFVETVEDLVRTWTAEDSELGRQLRLLPDYREDLPLDQFHRLLWSDEDLRRMVEQNSLRVHNYIDRIADVLQRMHWTYLRASSAERFLTSDSPVMVLDTQQLRSTPYIDGMTVPSAQVSFPITPTLALVATWRNAPDHYEPGTTRQVKNINRLTVGAAREAYASTKSEALHRMVQHLLGVVDRTSLT
jgi:hypothetical protein